MNSTNIKLANLQRQHTYRFIYNGRPYKGKYLEKKRDYSKYNPSITIVFDTFEISNPLLKRMIVYNLEEVDNDEVTTPFSDTESDNATTDSEEYEFVNLTLDKIDIVETDEHYAYVTSVVANENFI